MSLSAERREAEEREAQAYAADIRQPHTAGYWGSRNREIIARWSLAALLRVKTRAWAIVENGEAVR